MEMELVYLCVYLAEGITAWSYFSALYKRRYSLGISIAAYSLGYGAAFALFDPAYVWANTLVFALLNAALLLGLHFSSWKAGIFQAVMLTCLSMGFEIAFSVIVGGVVGDFNLYRSSTLVLAILSVSSKLLYFLSTKVCLWIARIFGFSGEDTGHASLFLSCVSITSICVLVLLFYIGVAVPLPIHIENLMLVSAMMLLFSNILLFAGYQYIQKVNQQNLLLQMVKQKDEAEEIYFRALEEKYDEQRVVIHDIRRHLAAIKGLAQEQGADRVAEYTSTLENLPVLQNKVRYCDNPMLNVVLSRYGELCHEKGIAFQADIRDREYGFLSPSDITALFGNLLENAVEAAQDSPRPYVELRVDTPAGAALFISL